jgi:cGMP-specific 3',5'-cyclic phosphodiesterase
MTLRLQILNIGDVSIWMNQETPEDDDGFATKSILCMPIMNGQKTVIGVAQLINKVTD